jgi:hypothetical protein
MTTFGNQSRSRQDCGESSHQNGLSSTGPFGSVDLDNVAKGMTNEDDHASISRD